MSRLILLIFTILAALGCQAEDFVIDIQQPRQTIRHFGASDAWSMQFIGKWENEQEQQKIADWLFSTENDEQGKPKGIGLSIWRFNLGAGSEEQGEASKIQPGTRTECFLKADGTYDWSKQAGQRKFLQMAKQRGVPYLLAFLDSPPVYFTQNGLATNTGRGGTINLRDDCYDDFADYMAKAVKGLQEHHGIHIDYLCPVNEPDGHWNWQGPKQEGTPATNREVARIAREMSREFTRRGLDTRIVINEASDLRCMMGTHHTDWQRGNEIQCFWNPDSADTYVGNLPNIAHVMAGHSYWTNTPVLMPTDEGYESEGLYGYRKRLRDAMDPTHGGSSLKGLGGFWMSELCIMSNDEEIHGGGGFDFSMEVALYVARIMHYDLTVANARSWQWWRAAGGDYKDGLIRMYVKGEKLYREGNNGHSVVTENSVRDSKLMWTIGNFSRFVRPGAVRLEVEGTMKSNGVMLSAYRNKDGRTAIVAINYSTDDRTIEIRIKGKKKATAYRTSDIEGENLRMVGRVNLKKTLLPARSVTTLLH